MTDMYHNMTPPTSGKWVSLDTDFSRKWVSPVSIKMGITWHLLLQENGCCLTSTSENWHWLIPTSVEWASPDICTMKWESSNTLHKNGHYLQDSIFHKKAMYEKS